MSNEVRVSNVRKFTFCRSVIEGGTECSVGGGACRFAHTIEDIYPRLCRFAGECKRKYTCGFVHPDEDIYQYSDRCKFVGDRK